MNKAAPAPQSPTTEGPLKYTKYGMLFGLVVVLVGVMATILYGYRPAPARIMKPSFFETPEQIGAVALKRFYAPLASEKITVLGIPTNRDWSTEVAVGFLLAAYHRCNPLMSRSILHVPIC